MLDDVHPLPHGLLDGLQYRLQRRSVDGPGPEAIPHREHEVGKRQQVGGIGLPAPLGLDPAPQIADAVRPAHLASLRRNAVVGRQPIRRHPPGEGRIQQGLQLRLAAAQLDQEQGRQRADRDPQPRHTRSFAPPGLVHMDMVGCGNGGLHLGVRGGEGRTGHLLKLADASDTHGDLPDQLHQIHQFAVAEAVASVQQGNQRHEPGTERPWRHVRGPFRRRPRLTARTDQGVILVFGNVGRGQRNPPDLLASRGPTGARSAGSGR